MLDNLSWYAVVFLLVVFLSILHRGRWRGGKTASTAPKPPKPKPKPFAGLTSKPKCERCERESEPHPQLPGAPPPRMRFTRGRHRQVDTTGPFCPHVTCSYHGWVGWGNIRAKRPPNGHRWRQLVWLGCRGYFLETVGTPFHAKQVAPDKLLGVIAALAEAFGIRVVARVFEVDPNTGLSWLVEAPEHLEAFSRYHLRDLHIEQVQMDTLVALPNAVKDSEVTETEAIQRLSRSPPWVWVAIDPVCKLILAVEVGGSTPCTNRRQAVSAANTVSCVP